MPPTTAAEELLEPLRRTFRWFAGLRGADGRIVCPWHGVEHTGSNAGLIVLACELLARDPAADRELLLRTARREAVRLRANLVREGTSPCHTFRPGRHDPFNCSNAVIDGGAATDALSTLVRTCGPELDAGERDACKAAALLHARTYLRYAVLDKGIPAQRAWGLTGLAGAWALEHDSELERAAIEAVGVLEGIQHADGSYPYHPVEWGAEHAGASDVSAFYQSRVTAFLFHALRDLGRDPAQVLFAPQLARGLDFLRALQGPDGLKCGLVEAKPWYWGDAHEVASHPFDVFALAEGARVLGRAGDARAALAAYRAWTARLADDGRPRDHIDHPGTRASYQCPVFWAGHAAWIARSLGVLEKERARAASERPAPTVGSGIDLAMRWFPTAELGRLEDGRVVAWVRGARPASNVNHGSPRGAGLVRVFDKRTGEDVLRRERFEPAGEGEWTARAAGSFARGWKSGGGELRFSLWTARVHARAGRTGAALAEPWRALREGVFAYAKGTVASSFALRPAVTAGDFEIVVEAPLAWRDGAAVPGTRVMRRFAIDGEGLTVDDHVEQRGSVRELAYSVPAAARSVERADDRVRYRLP